MAWVIVFAAVGWFVASVAAGFAIGAWMRSAKGRDDE
jgi:hypothetical protein